MLIRRIRWFLGTPGIPRTMAVASSRGADANSFADLWSGSKMYDSRRGTP